MPACPRRQIVPRGEAGVFHLWNRCVQRAFLCDRDPATGKNYEYRRAWIEDLERQLAGLFAIEVSHHAELKNHIHVVVRTRPDVAQTWDDRDVVRRWLIITRIKRSGSPDIVEPSEKRIATEMNKPGRVEELRRRLSDVSWWMGTLCENISRRCNKDSGTSGAFWEHRYKSRQLTDEASLLVCGVYVDLNVIRAGEALTPEESRHTSVYNRIEGLKWREAREQGAAEGQEPVAPDAWLCELTIQTEMDPDVMLASSSRQRASDKGLLSISLEKYLEILDWTGRQLRSDKKGAIPEFLAPILDRLGINGNHWLEAVSSFDTLFGHVVGTVESMTQLAQRMGRRWYHGQSNCAAVFG